MPTLNHLAVGQPYSHHSPLQVTLTAQTRAPSCWQPQVTAVQGGCCSPLGSLPWTTDKEQLGQ